MFREICQNFLFCELYEYLVQKIYSPCITRDCVGCPYQGQCRPKIDGRNATFITSKNASNRAKSQRYMQSEEFSNYAKLRNGVETVPANIRKNYRLDKLPRGKQRGGAGCGHSAILCRFGCGNPCHSHAKHPQCRCASPLLCRNKGKIGRKAVKFSILFAFKHSKR